MVVSRRTIRRAFAVVLVLALAVLVFGYVDAQRQQDAVTGDPAVEQAFRSGDRSAVVGARENVTVVATDSNAFVSDENDGPRAQAELVAFAPDGSIHYYENRHTRYWDVDPVEGTAATVEFVYADHLDSDECDGDGVCTENGVVRVNLTNGERTTVFSRVTAGKHSTRWHDVDRVDDERLLVADIAQDRAFVVNTTTELIEWEWEAQADYDIDSGGPFPSDWTHLNDVESVTIDGREAAMLSLRNQDQVVFVDYERGLLDEWTLGTDGDHDVLYEQHNPDFVPASEGGPAVLVADSENGRVVEYQHEDGTWNESWTWSDARLTWPRDADRLPNGHTLVTDSNGDRVLEVDRDGDVVWSASIGFPYEAERLGTGPESANGPSAAALDLPDRTPDEDGSLESRASALLPPSVQNAISYVLPRWVTPIHAVAVVLLLLVVPTWLALEYRWSTVSLGVRSPVTFEREE
ncbi:arylsulfotransferase (asst) [Halorubellus sp. JP-L1]|uniref:arylsulfotransferase family protein n=1 Tax=Halorubellus sp. JP-L1 TaxID=2715753 RepID=UPI00140DF7D1|nr:arylsulfotransferase family protein [Halorubellus sp. JP-L1]NHN43116.1 arylsulfotransferase (asst) [Halorubellus sp. JP-L1]